MKQALAICTVLACIVGVLVIFGGDPNNRPSVVPHTTSGNNTVDPAIQNALPDGFPDAQSTSENGNFLEEIGVHLIPLEISGGHSLESIDNGQPTILVAAGMGIAPETYRELFAEVLAEHSGAFSHSAMITKLAAHSINEQAYTQSVTYYSQDVEQGTPWPQLRADGFATVKDGQVTSIVVSAPGAGYTSIPNVRIPGYAVDIEVEMWYGNDLERNGSVNAITIVN